MGALAEGVAHRNLVGAISVSGDFRRAKDASTKVLHEVVRIGAIALADSVGDDRLLCTGECRENVLVTLGEGFMRLQPLLLFADKALHFVKLDPGDADAKHAAIVQLGAALADLEGELADSLTVDANQARRGPNANAPGKGGDDFNLLISRKEVHDGPNPTFEGLAPTLAKASGKPYIRSSRSPWGPIPG